MPLENYSPRKFPPHASRQRPKQSPFIKKVRLLEGRSMWWYVGIFFWLLLIVGVIGIFILYTLYLRDLPSITSIGSFGGISESTVIYDKNGNEIYKMHSENGKRTYVEYSEISQPIKDAIISAEDKTFFTNPWIDVKGIIRAVYNYVQGGSGDKIKGTSTISQQLIKNLLLTNEYSLRRKIREAVLSYQLNATYSKEKILELYLNTISFGNNAAGIEEAAKTYFWKSAKDVGVLGATILASLPKGPTYYSPYVHRDRLMGSVYVYESSLPDEHITLDSPESMEKYRAIYEEFKNYIYEMQFTSRDGAVMICNLKRGMTKIEAYEPNSEGCTTLAHADLLTFLNAIRIPREVTNDSGSVVSLSLEYEAWRKDFVAMRMYDDGKITDQEYHDILFNGLEFTFQKYVENIQYPYFVFYIKEYLENTYGNDLDITNGLRVYTTIDPELQLKAEDIVQRQVEVGKSKYNVSSAALVSMDNSNGHILAMVGGPNYYDEENGWNNNMTTASRQPWSSFKPIVYSLAIAKNPIWPASPITDTKTKFGNWEPDNYDKKFLWLMTVAKALDYSRNIPAVKMFYLAGQEDLIVRHAQSLWLITVREKADYGAPMALGTAEVRPIDMMQAYSIFANNGVKRRVTGVVKIEDSNGNVIESNEMNEWQEVFSPAASYITARILSDEKSRPESEFWRSALRLAGGRISAAKTGTSNKVISKTLILPRDLWTIGFTPQITTVVWAWNVDGRETKWNGDGLNVAAPIWRDFMNFAHTNAKKLDFTRPSGVYDVVISRTSGKLANENTPSWQRVETIMAVEPQDRDEGLKTLQIDILCGWPTSANTPEEAIRSVSVPQGKPFIDGFEAGWYKWWSASVGYLPDGTAVKLVSTPCERPTGPGNVTLSVHPALGGSMNEWRRLMEATWDGDRPIKTIRIFQGNVMKFETNYDEPKSAGLQRVTIQLDRESDTLSIEAVDTFGFRYNESSTVTVTEIPWVPSNTNPPVITMINPVAGDSSISIYNDQFFNLRFSVSSSTMNNEISVAVDGKTVKTMTTGNAFAIPINEGGNLSPWNHTATVRVVDSNLKNTTQTIQFTVLSR